MLGSGLRGNTVRIELTAGGSLPGEAVEGRLTGKVKRKPRSILVEIVTVESARGNTSTIVRSSQRFRDLGEGELNQAFSLKLSASATQAGSCIYGKVAWIIRARADLAGLDQKTERPIPVKRPPHRVSAQDHPSAKVIKGAIQAQRSNLPQYKPHGRRQQEFLMLSLPILTCQV